MSDVEKAQDARIDVSAQLISLDPGLFTVSVAAPSETRTEAGMVLPCVRIDSLPKAAGGTAYVSSLSETSLLTPTASTAYLRISGGRTSVLLTTYKISGPVPPPEIRITMVDPTPLPAEPVAMATQEEALPSNPIDLLVHVENYGDLRFGAGVWAGAVDGTRSIEGFAITLDPALPRQSVEYQAVLGQDWSSPWMGEGEFCGSRQLALPLLGVLVRLRGTVAEEYACRVWGRFGGTELGPFEDGEVCKAEGAPLTGLRVVVVPRDPSGNPPPGGPMADPPR